MASLALPLVSIGTDDYAHDALDKCKSGSCANCGLCCTTMETVVPSERGELDSPLIRKRAGEVCPQLVRTHRGRYLCALHAHVQAGDPRLVDCAAWSGDGNGILQLVVKTEEWIARPPDSAASEMIADLVRLKLLAGFQREADPHEALDVVRHYAVQLGVVPQETFELLGIRGIFRRLYRQESPLYFQFDRELWVASPEVYRCFFEQYVWGGESPYARDEQRVRLSGP